ncbi:SusD/RagB family nutrient-binding outer membrane lipoprotein [Chryseobacterium sp.]|uniref:SusD/RagB family nutrient-binding outer membrane lipoprotein n=1 Tax=Chryseobacterium sp. TaxID=1871047 RepID=UPI0025C1E90E|nr:SusD/RagB family nutrient-binding outer membrane lipoprotein [Chryseobacterium sp.]
MKKIKFLLSASVIALSLTSCNNYLDVNEDPNNLPIENVTPELILPGVISQMYRVQSGNQMQLGNLMMNNWAGNTYVFGGPYSAEFTLGAVNSQFYNGIWDDTYRNLYNFKIVETYPNADHKQDYYVAIAKILKAFYLQPIVDLYGDIPYSEAFQAQANSTPKYDNDEDVYKALISSIDEGIALIEAADASVSLNPGAADIVFQGNMDSWVNFANTIKLRFLVRMSKATGDMGAYRDMQLSALSASNPTFITGDVYENPGYSTASNDAMNPLMYNYRNNAAGSAVQNYNLVTVSEHMANALEGNEILNSAEYSKFTGIKDGRRYRLFSQISYTFNGVPYARLKGIRQGATAGQPGAEIDPNSASSRTVSKLANGTFIGNVTTGGTVISASNARGGTLMTLAESNLLQAEAALRWPSLFTVDAQSKFTQAITASYNYFGATAGTAPAYIASISSRIGLGWTGTTEQKIEAIITQKWLALTNVNPIESFIEYNRTGYPYTPLAVTAVMANKPYRLQYPQSEFSANSANTPNIPTAQLFTKNQYTPFWNQN